MFVPVLNPVSFVYAGNRNLRVYQTGATRNNITSDSIKSLEHQMTCLHIETVKSTEMMQRCPFLPYGLAKCKSRGFQILEWGSKWFSCNMVRKKGHGPSKLIFRSFDHSEKDAFRCIQSSWPGQLPHSKVGGFGRDTFDWFQIYETHHPTLLNRVCCNHKISSQSSQQKQRNKNHRFEISKFVHWNSTLIHKIRKNNTGT